MIIEKHFYLQEHHCSFLCSFSDDYQGIIQKKLASGNQTLPLVIDEKVPFFPQKQCYFKVFVGKTIPKVPFLKECRHQKCPFLKIPDAALKF